MGIEFDKVISDKSEMRINRKLSGSTSVQFYKTASIFVALLPYPTGKPESGSPIIGWVSDRINVRKWLTLDWFIKSISSNISAKPASFLNALNIYFIFCLILRTKYSPNSTFLSLNRSTIILIITVYHPKIWATGFIGSDGYDFKMFLAYRMINLLNGSYI